MTASVRQVEGNTVLRLFPTEKEAQDTAVVIARGALQRFQVALHESQNGWLILDTESGRRIDVAGLIQ